MLRVPGRERVSAYAVVVACCSVMLAGCGGPASSSPGGGTVGSVYVVQSTGTGVSVPTSTSILKFSGSSSGVVTPAATITSPAGIYFIDVGVDSSGNIYATAASTSSTAAGEILVYAAGASGAATPTRVLTGVATRLAYPLAITADATGQIYVADNMNGILVFAAGANGNIAPVRQINGSLVPIGTALGIAVDSSGTVYIANDGVTPENILEFSSAANGNVAPTRTLAGAATTLGGVLGLAIDSANNLYVGSTGNGSATAGVAVFAQGANGNATPIRVIEGSNVGISNLDGMGMDAEGNIYVQDVANFGFAYLNSPSIKVYAAGATGNVAPTRTFSSAQWTGAGDDGMTAF